MPGRIAFDIILSNQAKTVDEHDLWTAILNDVNIRGWEQHRQPSHQDTGITSSAIHHKLLVVLVYTPMLNGGISDKHKAVH